MNIILLGFLGSLAAGLGTGVGALPALFTTRVSRRTMNALLGFAALFIAAGALLTRREVA